VIGACNLLTPCDILRRFGLLADPGRNQSGHALTYVNYPDHANLYVAVPDTVTVGQGLCAELCILNIT
jgi:hypothetical protein